MLRPENRSVDGSVIMPNDFSTQMKKSTTIDDENEGVNGFGHSSQSPQSQQANIRPHKLEPVLPKAVMTAQKHSRTQANFYSDKRNTNLANVNETSSNHSGGGWGPGSNQKEDYKQSSPMMASATLEIPQLNNYQLRVSNFC
jgi:hypothetical protein